ncbi:MAG: GGDEF domain-containing protein, partial [Acholeplasmatales bacterium]|nr:GGDEF domain-containing protein [Acholeplasmatales bacterium]
MTFEDFNLKDEFFNNFSYDEIKDSLTGSINRQYLLKYMSYLIDNNIPFNLISFDIDKLKLFNSDNGHLNGDLLIKKLIDIILPLLPKNSIIGKLDGDEISIVIKGEYSYDEKWSLLRSIHQETRKPIIINDKSYLVT